MLLIFPLLAVLFVSWACGAGLTITHDDGSSLTVWLRFSNQFSQAGPMVQLTVFVRDSHIRGNTELDPNARLTCEGANVAPEPQIVSKPCPRQPPGGVYHIVYTDEHGHTATAIVPIPTGQMALLNPHEESTIHLPASGVLPIHYAAPVAPAGGSVEIHDVSARCGKIGEPDCGDTFGGETPIGTGGPGVYPLKGAFTQFTTGPGWVNMKPGWVNMNTTAVVLVQPGGFHDVTASFEDNAFVNVTWAV